VAALAHVDLAYRLAAATADLVFVTPQDTAHAAAIAAEVRAAEAAAGRTGPPVQIIGDVLVFLDDETSQAAGRRARLDALAGREYRSDALIFAC
jgi:alkanesulfonate monooxygenase SsuD/methylene tetrahydromethanopterin reductase-like flavin-dependent oxidoreductase (luciferase family)